MYMEIISDFGKKTAEKVKFDFKMCSNKNDIFF